MDANQPKLNYLDTGANLEPAIIFIHGNYSAHSSFRYQLVDPRFTQYRLISVDLPGHGLSSPAESYSLTTLAAEVTALVSNLGLKKFYLVGHSLGGHVAMEMLNDLVPEGILIFGAPPLTLPLDMSGFRPYQHMGLLFKNQLTDSEMQVLITSFYVTDPSEEADLHNLRRTDLAFRESIGQSLGGQQFTDELILFNGFKGKKAIVNGRQDRFINSDYFTDRIDHDTLLDKAVFQLEAGHNLHIEKHQEFNDILDRFLRWN